MTDVKSPHSLVIPPAPHVIEGEHLCLCDVTPGDANEAYANWMNDPEVNCYTESRFIRHTPESIRQYIEAVNKTETNLFLAIIAKNTGRHIGNIKLNAIDRHHGTAEVGIIIGDKSCLGRGFGGEAVDLLAGYAFKTLGLRKLTAGFYATNTGSIRAFEKAGFVAEGVMKAQFISNGTVINGVRLGRVCSSATAAVEE